MLKIRKLFKDYKIIFIAAAAFAAYFAVSLAFDIPCVIRESIGVSCPGCGMTRAVIAAFRGDFCAALAFHPLLFVMPPLVFMLFFSAKDTRFFTFLIIFFAVLLFAVYFLRLADPADTIVMPSGRGIIGLFRSS